MPGRACCAVNLTFSTRGCLLSTSGRRAAQPHTAKSNSMRPGHGPTGLVSGCFYMEGPPTRTWHFFHVRTPQPFPYTPRLDRTSYCWV
eukprot:361037-Chlamydomonas_euryale.AAC.2